MSHLLPPSIALSDIDPNKLTDKQYANILRVSHRYLLVDCECNLCSAHIPSETLFWSSTVGSGLGILCNNCFTKMKQMEQTRQDQQDQQRTEAAKW